MSDDSGTDPYLSYGLRDTFISAPLVEAFMDGIYTMLFIYTMALMFARPKFAAANKWLLASLTILYGFTIAHLGIQWVYTRQIYLLNGDSPDDMLNAIFDESLTMVMASSTLNVASTLIADGILVWRCWIIWNRDWKAIVLPLITLFAEVATGIWNLYQQAQPFSADNVTADPATVYLALSLVCTVMTTLLIVFRIVRLGSFANSSPHKNVIEIVVESALLYSLALILFLPLYVQVDLHLNFMSEYLKRVVVGMTGIAPTLIVARVAMGVARPSTSWSQYSNSQTGSRTKFSSMAPMMVSTETKKVTDSITSEV